MTNNEAKKKGQGWVWCRPGNHSARRNQIAVHYEPGFGICGHCVVRRSTKLADYWTTGRALDSRCDANGVPCSPVI